MSNPHIQLSDHFTYPRLLRFVAPSIAMMIFTSIYGVVDGFFVSNYVGKTPFAALNFIMPFIMVLGGTGFMLGTGGSALVAKEMGCGHTERANRIFTMMIAFVVVTGLILTALGVAFIRPIARLMGASESIMADCVLYGRITIAFTTAFMLQNVFQSFLVVAERPRVGLLVVVAAGVTNMALDALFIAVFRWGLAGAALATGIGQCIGGIVPAVYILRRKDLPLRFAPFKFEASPILHACANGSSEFMSNISTSFVSMLYNMQLLRMLGEDGVSAYGVLMYVQLIFIGTAIGYSIGCAPIVSYHYGAGHHDELKNMLKKSLTLMGITGVALTMLALGLATPLAKIFVGYDEGLLCLTRHAFSIFSFSFLLSGLNIFASGFFTALNNGLISAVISFARTLVFQAACVLLLPAMFGVDGIWYATLVAEGLACLLSLWLIDRKKHFYHYDK